MFRVRDLPFVVIVHYTFFLVVAQYFLCDVTFAADRIQLYKGSLDIGRVIICVVVLVQ